MASKQVHQLPALPIEPPPPPSLEHTLSHPELPPCYFNARRRKSRKQSRRDDAKKRPRGPEGKFLAKGDHLPITRTTDLANADSAGRVACEHRPGEEGKDQACNGRHDEDKAKSNGSARIPMSMTTSFDGKKEQKTLYQIDKQIWKRLKGLVSDYQYREDFQCWRWRFLTQTT